MPLKVPRMICKFIRHRSIRYAPCEIRSVNQSRSWKTYSSKFGLMISNISCVFRDGHADGAGSLAPIGCKIKTQNNEKYYNQ